MPLCAPRSDQFVAHFDWDIHHMVAMHIAELAPFTQAVFCGAKTMRMLVDTGPAQNSLCNDFLRAFDGQTTLLRLNQIELRQLPSARLRWRRLDRRVFEHELAKSTHRSRTGVTAPGTPRRGADRSDYIPVQTFVNQCGHGGGEKLWGQAMLAPVSLVTSCLMTCWQYYRSCKLQIVSASGTRAKSVLIAVPLHAGLGRRQRHPRPATIECREGLTRCHPQDRCSDRSAAAAW